MIFALTCRGGGTDSGTASATADPDSSIIEVSTDFGSSARAWFEIVLKVSAVAVRPELSTTPKGNFSDGYLGGGAFRRARYRLRRSATSFRHVVLSASEPKVPDSDNDPEEPSASSSGSAEAIGNSLQDFMGQLRTSSDFEYIM
jgi:hypothetical protein